jgi:hypothetical protein
LPAYILSVWNVSVGNDVSHGWTTCVGFQLSYYSVGPSVDVCRGGTHTLTGAYGRIVDGHGTSNVLPASVNCSWLVDPRANSGWELVVTLLDLPLGHAWLRVYDGSTRMSPLLAEYTGSDSPDGSIVLGNSLTASGGTLLLEYTTDDYSANPAGSGQPWVGRGFEAVYFGGGCFGQVRLSDPAGTFQDGSGDLSFNSYGCQWLIQPAPGVEQIVLSFDWLDLGYTPRVRIFDGNTTSAPEPLGWWGDTALTPATMISSGSSVLVEVNAKSSCTLFSVPS